MPLHKLPTRLTLIAHAATSAQKAGRFPGDEALEDATQRRLEQAVQPLRGDLVLTAPERCAQQTAAGLGLQALEAKQLRDCGYGRWAGRSLEELCVSEPEAVAAWIANISAAPHGGESFQAVIERTGAWMEACRGSGHVIAVTHATVVRAAVVHALFGAPHAAYLRVEIAPLSVTDLRLTAGTWRVRSLGVPYSGWPAGADERDTTDLSQGARKG